MRVPRNAALLLVLLLVSGLVWVAAGEARMNGVSGRALDGCTCHGNAGAPWTGVGGQLPMALFLQGVPDEYEPGKDYPLDVSVSGGFPYLKAGFNLNATAGAFAVPADETNVQITTQDTFGGAPGEATHKTPDSRAWKVVWTAPREGNGTVAFFLAVNSVNGQSQPDALDQWNRMSTASAEKNLAPQPPVVVAVRDLAPGAIAVNWTPSPDLDIVRHEVYAGPPGFTPGSDTLRASAANATAEELDVTGLQPGSDVEVVLRAVDRGGLSADSAPLAARLAPAAVPPVEAPAKEGKLLPVPAMPSLMAALGAAAVLGRKRS